LTGFNPDSAIRNKMAGWDRFEAAENPQMNTNKPELRDRRSSLSCDHVGTEDKTRISANETQIETNQEGNALISRGFCSGNRRANILFNSRDSRSGFLFWGEKAL
jgi:hypothetical protein